MEGSMLWRQKKKGIDNRTFQPYQQKKRSMKRDMHSVKVGRALELKTTEQEFSKEEGNIFFSFALLKGLIFLKLVLSNEQKSSTFFQKIKRNAALVHICELKNKQIQNLLICWDHHGLDDVMYHNICNDGHVPVLNFIQHKTNKAFQNNILHFVLKECFLTGQNRTKHAHF